MVPQIELRESLLSFLPHLLLHLNLHLLPPLPQVIEVGCTQPVGVRCEGVRSDGVRSDGVRSDGEGEDVTV